MIDKCPECGGELQATIPLYLSKVVLSDAGFIVNFAPAFASDVGLGMAVVNEVDPSDVQIYCENDHDLKL